MQAMAAEGAAQQPPAATPSPWCLGQVLAKRLGPLQGPQPEQSAEPTTVQHEMHGQLKLLHQCGHPLQGQQISTTAFGMATMAEAVELPMLSGPKTADSAAEMGLLQRLISQDPAERRPSERPGSRVR